MFLLQSRIFEGVLKEKLAGQIGLVSFVKGLGTHIFLYLLSSKISKHGCDIGKLVFQKAHKFILRTSQSSEYMSCFLS